MLIRASFTLVYISLLPIQMVLGQSFFNIDTLHTDETASHMQLTIKIPLGEMFMESSGICGKSVTSLSGPDSMFFHQVKSEKKSSGAYDRTCMLEFPTPPTSPSISSPNSALLRLSDGSQAKAILPEKAYRTEFKPDPEIPTSLSLELGKGGSMLDLSDMSLNNMKINSAFSDVLISYDKPNQITMEKMDIQAANAKIVIKNLELALAKLITIQNEMGETKLFVGDKSFPASDIHINSGVGDCTLIIDRDQPTKLVLKSGIFSNVEVSEEFKPHGKGTYVNQAYQKDPAKCVKIFCTVDFGNISILSK